MFLQENTAFGNDLRVKCHMRCDVAQCPLYHMTCAPANFEVAASIGVEDDAFTLK